MDVNSVRQKAQRWLRQARAEYEIALQCDSRNMIDRKMLAAMTALRAASLARWRCPKLAEFARRCAEFAEGIDGC